MGRTVLREALAAGIMAIALTGSASAQGVERQTYIVMLDRQAGVPAAIATEVSQRFGGDVGYVYGAIGGFSITLPPAAAAALASDPRVALIAPEGMRRIVQQAIPTGLDRTFATVNPSLDIDATDDWRVDADVAVLDSGIDRQHGDLNVVEGVNCLVNSGNKRNPVYSCSQVGEDGDDDEGHGTHVAGTIGALDNGQDVVGMAPGVRLWAVKVCDNRGNCPDSVVIAGIDWAVQRATEIEVINMSLTGPVSDPDNDPYESAIDAAIAAGIVVVVAAGNNGLDASGYSPARVRGAITVSAIADYDGLPGGTGGNLCTLNGPFGYSGPDDARASFSNYGAGIDIAAPGVCILSTRNGGGTELNLGTSMAAPHVAGAAAVIASRYPTPLSPTDVAAIEVELLDDTNFDWTDTSGDGVLEPLLQNTRTAAVVPVGAGPDVTPPTPVISTTAADPTASASVPLRIDFGEAVTDFVQADISVGNGSVTGFSGSDGDSFYDVTVAFASPVDGLVMTVDVAAGSASDLAGNASVAAAQFTISYEESNGTGIIVTASGYKVRGVQHVDLTWSGSTQTSADIKRDGQTVATVPPDAGAYTDNIGNKGGGTYVYEVCEASTSTCSAPVTVTF